MTGLFRVFVIMSLQEYSYIHYFSRGCVIVQLFVSLLKYTIRKTVWFFL